VKLRLYSSTARSAEPNLVSLQHPQLVLATELVCPLKRQATRTLARALVEIDGVRYVVLCDLARPIHRRALRSMGELDEAASQRVIEAFLGILAV
jgi:hypothetical protein